MSQTIRLFGTVSTSVSQVLEISSQTNMVVRDASFGGTSKQ